MLKIKPGVMLYLKYLYPYTTLILSLPLKWIPQIMHNKSAQIGVFEFIILSVVVAVPLIKVARFSLTVSGSEVVFKEGLFFTRKRCIEQPNLAVISIDRGPIARLLCSAKIKVYSPAGTTSRPIINAYISRQSADILQRSLLHQETRAVKRFKFSQILLYCLGNSSFIAGVFVSAPFINRFLTLTGRSLAQILSDSVLNESPKLISIIKLSLKAPLIILLLGYVFDFLKTFIDMFSFKLTENNAYLSLRRGFVKLHTAFIPKESICAVVCRQTPIFSAFKLKSVSILSNGYGRQIRDKDCILPITHEQECPGLTPDLEVLISPQKKAKLRPAKPYLFFLALTLIASIVSEIILPNFELLQITLVAIFLYLLSATFIRLGNFNKCFLMLGNTLSVKAQHRLSLREMHLPKSHIAAIKITQNPLDKRYGVCKTQIFAAHKRAVSVKIKNLPQNQVIFSISEFFANN